MVIKNSFKESVVKEIADQIYTFIRNESELTDRSWEDIESMIINNNMYVLVDSKDIVYGFIGKEQLVDNYYELKSWYIVPEKRNTELAENIFKAAIQNKKHSYVGATFQTKIITKLKKYGFKETKLTKLPAKLLIRYISTRKFSSIIKHIFRRKSYLIIKQ